MSTTATTLVELHELSSKAHADRPALALRQPGAESGDPTAWRWVSYGELHVEVDRLRSGLAARGVAPGDRVAIISNNRLEWPVICYAVTGLGAVLVPMYEAQRPAEWEFILRDSGASVVVASRTPIVDAVRAMRPSLPALRHVIGMELPSPEPDSFDALRELGAARPVPPATPGPDDLAEIVYTSGTTGKPKGVLLTHRSIVSDVHGMHAVFPIDSGERLVSFLPWAHVFGQIGELHHGLSIGVSIAINDDLPRLMSDLQEIRPTLLVAVPSIFNRIYESVVAGLSDKPRIMRKMFRDGIEAANGRRRGEPVGPVRRLELALDDKLIFTKIREKLGGQIKWVFSGGAALNPEVAELIDAVGIPVHEGYGLTETSCTVSLQPMNDRRLGTVGKPLPGVRVAIDTAASDDPRAGEIVVYGPIVMSGYYKRPAENAQAFTADGGFRTGDLGFFDDDGYLVITGRIKEIYKLSNGKYVVPVPMEEEIKLSPYIENLVIHGADRAYNIALVAPDRLGLAAWAERHGKVLAGDLASDPEIIALIAAEIDERSARFPSYQRPRKFFLLSQGFSTENGFLTPTLKVKRHRIVAEYAADIERLYAEPPLERAAERLAPSPAPAAPPA